ncbi:hypothetical protein RB601_006170 [Gaeumannomyces tritici]
MRTRLINQPAAAAAALYRRGCNSAITTTIITSRGIATTTTTATTTMASKAANNSPIRFGPFEVTSQVFLTTPHSFALVNLKPLLPGHVLVCPRAPHRRLTDLAAPELTDLFCAVQRVQRMLARHYFSSSSSSSHSSSSSAASAAAAAAKEKEHEEGGSFNIAVQDGPEAGQTVPHVHVHVIPRRGGTAAADHLPNGGPDELYERMHGEDGNVGGKLWDAAAAAAAVGGEGGGGKRPEPGGGFPRIEDADRAPRSMGEMEAEAALFRGVLARMAEEEEGQGQGR